MTKLKPQNTIARRRTVRPAVSVIVVNYRQWAGTYRVVRSLARSDTVRRGGAEIVVIDNDSPSHPAIEKLKRRRRVSLQFQGRNLGFAHGVNKGARLSQGDWLLLLNPDTTVSQDWLDRLHDKLDAWQADPRLGIVGFQLRNEDGTWQGCSGDFPSLAGTLVGLLRPRAWRKYRRSRRRRPSWVTGCAMLIRRECWHDLKGFDPDFFLYYEDVDLCRRARARGWTVGHEPSLEVIHHKPLHLRRKTPRLHLCTRHGLLTYARKHWPAWQSSMLSWLIRLEGWWRRRSPATSKFIRTLNRVADFPEQAARLVRRALNARHIRWR